MWSQCHHPHQNVGDVWRIMGGSGHGSGHGSGMVDSVDRMTEKYFLVSCFFAVFRIIPIMIPTMIQWWSIVCFCCVRFRMIPMILSDRKVFQIFEGCLLHYKKHASQTAQCGWFHLSMRTIEPVLLLDWKPGRFFVKFSGAPGFQCPYFIIFPFISGKWYLPIQHKSGKTTSWFDSRWSPAVMLVGW